MTRLVLLKQNSYEVFTGNVVGVDLSSYGGTDYISIACPEMSADIDLENSYLDITFQENGDFTRGFASVSFDENVNELDLPGDSELRFLITNFRDQFQPTALENAIANHNPEIYDGRSWNNLTNEEQNLAVEMQLDKIMSSITGIRFRINVDDDLVFKVMSVRAISSNWKYAPLDIDTISECIELPVSPTGDPSYPYEFPIEENGLEFSDWPITWQSIYPKNFSVSAEFVTGSLTGENSFYIFFRGGNVNKGIVNDLEDWQGTEGPATMDQLNGLALETDIAEEASESLEYLSAQLTWSAEGSFLSVSDSLNELYSFDFDLSPDKRYMATFINKDDSFRVKIHEIDADFGSLKEEVFDSELMSGYLFAPRSGFFGWWAKFEDGDSFVDNVRHRHANFGDLTTRQFQSITPVQGVQLSQISSPPTQLINEFASGLWGGVVSEDLEANTYQIISQGNMEGIQTNNFIISDWENTFIEFEIYQDFGDYVCYLLGINGNIIELSLGEAIVRDWKKVRHEFDGRPDPTGTYRLVILKVESPTDSLWKVRNFKAEVKNVHWSARNHDDPWNMSPEEWIPFGETTNKTNSGLMFKEPGQVQVKATLANNDAEISEFHVVPKYAELGRLVFEDEKAEDLKHKVKIAAEVNGLNVNFAANIEY